MEEKRPTTLDRLIGCEFRYVEWVIVILAAMWSFWLLFVIDMTRDVYAYMIDMVELVGVDPRFTPRIWGFVLSALGLLLAVGLISNRLIYRKVALFFLSIYWIGVLSTLGIKNAHGTAMATHTPLAILILAAFLRIANRRA